MTGAREPIVIDSTPDQGETPMSDTETTVLSDRAQGVIADIRALLDWLEERPLLADKVWPGSTFYAIANTPAEWRALLAELGTFDKSASDNYINAERAFGRIKFEVTASRAAVCERVKVGERPVTREVYPEHVRPEIVTETEDVYEWVCPPSWLADTDHAPEPVTPDNEPF